MDKGSYILFKSLTHSHIAHMYDLINSEISRQQSSIFRKYLTERCCSMWVHRFLLKYFSIIRYTMKYVQSFQTVRTGLA